MGDDVALGDAPLCFEGTEREAPPLVAKLDTAIGVCVDSAPLASKRERLGAGFDQVDPAPVVDCEFPRDLSIFLPAEDTREILVVANQAWSQPSIWISSLTQERRWRG